VNEITIEPLPYDAFDDLITQPPPAEVDTTSGPVLMRATAGFLLAAILPYEGDLSAYRRACIEYVFDANGVIRGSGISNRAQVFGYVGRNPLLGRYGCSVTSGARRHPEAHATLCAAGETLADMMRRHLPEVVPQQEIEMQKVHADWTLPGGFWTSGVLNETSELPYHYDRNNLDGWSAMVTIRRHTRGGHLHVPALDTAFRLRDGDVLFFNGRRLLHGVTPIQKLRDDAYRYTSVYYPVKKLTRCLPCDEEIAAARRRSTEAETNRRARHAAANDND